LLALSDVDERFGDRFIEELARTAKFSNGVADIVRFGDDVRVAVRIFLEAKNRLSTSELRSVVASLYRLSSAAERGDPEAKALSCAIAEMPIDVRRWLTTNTPSLPDIPDPGEFVSLTTRQSAIERLRSLLTYGGSITVGRKRAHGKRSRSFEPWLNVPTNIEGKPRDEAARQFVMWLAVAYATATGKQPPYTAHYKKAIRGPFTRLAVKCFERVGAPTGNVARLINEYGAARRRHDRGATSVT
jgi:hypothetical protein